jgi:glycosyltransferase involved in cell wall biosynthesis
MKIAFFHELPPGGARIATHQIAKLLKKSHQIDLYYVDEHEELEEAKNYANTFFYKFVPKMWNGKNWKVRLLKDTVELFKLYLLHKKIAEDIRKKNYDLVFVNASKYIESPFILRFQNTKKIFYLHDPHFRVVYEDTVLQKEKLDIARRVYHKLNRLILKIIDMQNLGGADLFIANSVFTQKTFKKTYGKESIVSYLGISTDNKVSKDVTKEFDILYIGSHDPLDDYDLLVEALDLIDKKPTVRTILKEDEWISSEEMNKLYKKSKIVLALGKNEPFGLIPLEAMENRVPVIAINEGGYKETVVDNKTGFLINRSPRELAEKISLLLKNNALRKKLGTDAEIYVKRKWTWETHIKKLEKIFTEFKKTNKDDYKNHESFPRKLIIGICLTIFVFALGLRLWNLNQMGRTWDESWYVEQGYLYDKAIMQGDFKNKIWYKDPDTPPLAKYVYGIGANLDIQSYKDGKPIFNYDYTHTRIIAAIVAALTAVVIFFIGARYFSLFVGIVAAVVFSMLPISLGLTQLVTLESFLLLFFTLAISSFLYLLEKITFRRIMLAGFLTGLAISVKITNVWLFPVFAGIYFSWFRERSSDNFFKHLDYRLFLIIPFALLTLIFLWPSIMLYPSQVASYTMALRGSQALVPIHETFFGIFMGVPVPYFFVYFLITTPIIVLLFFFSGLKKISDQRKWVLYALVWWFVIPFIQSFYNFRQNGIRYIIEIYAPLSLIAAIGFTSFTEYFTRSVRKKIILSLLLFTYLFIILFHITPYYLNYFNEVVGGTSTVYAKKLFPIGWWGDGMRETGLYLEKNIPTGSNVGLEIVPKHTLYQPKDLVFKDYNISGKEYDYVVVNSYAVIRTFFDESVLAKDYTLIHTISADGAPLVHIYKHK